MAERRKPNYMSIRGMAEVASIEAQVCTEAIRRLAGTEQATPDGFATTIRDLSTRFTGSGGVIDERSGLGPRQREKVREAVMSWASDSVPFEARGGQDG
ncbi:hypothetical protein A3F00_03670 [Candidatus Daviesbacteria bacterium RIFCSPHIGHO2_12_FULL_37_11]|uniref:Uncharacterized protein n=1 Tax=Candidatus Daviesbacteria bacterium RIFCSPHIGHO2_12_FULL_37_11 TaxID=1797777 RepID=A0A1F5KDR5_9BACT|nr:MAG: hypothetical protein A2769_00970 [Candidatus Daviesbacteria bacterium RIFCSPHIGHO2_01_FULL_37_27]OGE38741.1 MAG: hypothetical protein A3F00_03670 [Candidatus Daviesbacteria bacterium RIFCSPHIGHO2_12_FULL_37_11]OGE45830.1 MAG: hypothetical protein A3B39_01210 [Candidatus Daviesbacteria bacterium RIFCSPLOWO2_01_FULL_37_10]